MESSSITDASGRHDMVNKVYRDRNGNVVVTELVSDLFTPIQTPTKPAPAKVPVMMSLFGLVSLSYIGFTKKNEHK
ncbi:hypothetical protein ADO06_00273 [Streptococcus parauberis]|nr:hypothetical protein ADO06_00273 [Streptococcus parauberis]